ncbi:carboxypeptidase-like regulatory domain-containing protein [Bremerella cremea]|uniref:carboxypeptidase-like regulatory domain-containing protein n=1 Tax=Bremerella cremea TaxID=1031537 RepID=UPI0031E61B4F
MRIPDSAHSRRLAKCYSLSLLLLLLATLGCQRVPADMGSVSGTVTLDGEPVRQAMVTFTPQTGGRESFGVTNESGVYKLRYSSQEMGAKIGGHEVRICPVGVEPRQPLTKQQPAEDGLPGHYYGNDFLVQQVAAGHNTIDLNLSSTPPAKPTGKR